MKKAADFSTIGIDTREVRAFAQIAMRAGEREVFQITRTAVLARDDVLDVKRKHAVALGEAAVFTVPASPFKDQAAVTYAAR